MKRILEYLIHKLPHDLAATDKHGRNAFLYADDVDLIKFIISNEPSIMWSVDSEGRNIFHFFFIRWYSDPYESQIRTLKELFQVVPSELLREPDCHGKQPANYLYDMGQDD